MTIQELSEVSQMIAKDAESKAASVPVCFCGVPLVAIGRGAYPYDCIAKDERPNAMIYSAETCGHKGWTSRVEVAR